MLHELTVHQNPLHIHYESEINKYIILPWSWHLKKLLGKMMQCTSLSVFKYILHELTVL